MGEDTGYSQGLEAGTSKGKKEPGKTGLQMTKMNSVHITLSLRAKHTCRAHNAKHPG